MAVLAKSVAFLGITPGLTAKHVAFIGIIDAAVAAFPSGALCAIISADAQQSTVVVAMPNTCAEATLSATAPTFSLPHTCVTIGETETDA